MSPRPGFVLEVDRSTPPTLMWHGEGFRLERLPVGTRVVYGPEPLAPLADPDARDPPRPRASARRLRSRSRTLLFPGMRLTIAFDDISLPLPPMRAPDVRQRVIEAVLDLAAEAGVDDVVLIAALALHRRMTDAELRHALGDRDLRGLRAPRPAAAARCRGPLQPRPPRAHRPRRGRRDQPPGGRERPARLREHQPRRRWTAGTSRSRPGSPPTGASSTTTTCARCCTAARSWTCTTPSCTPRTGAWAG